MKLSLTSWSLRACTLREAAAISRALGIGALDLGYFYGPALDRERLLGDPEGLAREVAGLEVGLPNLYHLFGTTLGDRNLADPATLDRNAEDFRKVARFCQVAQIPTVFVLPGICNPGQGRAEAMQHAAHALATLVPIAHDAGITLTIEPHVHSFLESPALVEDLVSRVPALRLTLDYAHFVCLGYRQEEIDPLARHAAHIHLRQARPGVLQAKLAEGTINFAALLGTLQDVEYRGALSLEYVNQDYMDTRYDDVLTETILMRDLVREWLG